RPTARRRSPDARELTPGAVLQRATAASKSVRPRQGHQRAADLETGTLLHRPQAIVLGGDLDRQILVLDLGDARVDLQPDGPLLEAGRIDVLVAKHLHAVDRHADLPRREAGQDLAGVPEMRVSL